jgi:hypothetical protein
MTNKYALINEKGEIVEKYRCKSTAVEQKSYFQRIYGKLKIIELKDGEETIKENVL